MNEWKENLFLRVVVALDVLISMLGIVFRKLQMRIAPRCTKAGKPETESCVWGLAQWCMKTTRAHWSKHQDIFSTTTAHTEELCIYIHGRVDVKFASGIKNIIWLYTHTPMCVKNSTLCTFPAIQFNRHNTRVGFEPTTFAILEQMHWVTHTPLHAQEL